MAISTNSIFHFTKPKSILNTLLKDGGFKITYCLENYIINEANVKIAIPMVSFCDIPLSSTINHIKSYGQYAVGLSKTWAKENKINPVLYMVPNSYSMELIVPFIVDTINNDEYGFKKRRKLEMLPDNKAKLTNIYTGERKRKIDAVIGLLSFIKNHDGDLIRKGQLIKKNYKFYDEREWRYIATQEIFDRHHISYNPLINTHEYNDWRNRTIKKEFIPGIKLTFKATDIDYIILRYESQKKQFIKDLEGYDHLYENDFDYNNLLTKLISTEKIMEDL